MHSPDEILSLGHWPDFIRTNLRKFSWFCPVQKAQILTFHIRPPHPLLRVLPWAIKGNLLVWNQNWYSSATVLCRCCLSFDCTLGPTGIAMCLPYPVEIVTISIFLLLLLHVIRSIMTDKSVYHPLPPNWGWIAQQWFQLLNLGTRV